MALNKFKSILGNECTNFRNHFYSCNPHEISFKEELQAQKTLLNFLFTAKTEFG